MPSPTDPNRQPNLWLRLAREMRGMSQRDLQKATGMTQVGISHIESGRSKNPHMLTRRAIAEALGFSPEELFPPVGSPSPSKELRALAKKKEKK
jgi:transcriptional regulator with XRE-family HTH domain